MPSVFEGPGNKNERLCELVNMASEIISTYSTELQFYTSWLVSSLDNYCQIIHHTTRDAFITAFFRARKKNAIHLQE